MHLQFVHDPATGKYKARPNIWVVIDDYGTEHDALYADEPGALFPEARSRRRDFRLLDLQDPDHFRAYWSTPRPYWVQEAMAFSSPIGLSIEVDLRIYFRIHPAWDEEAGDAHFERDRGARLEVVSQEAWLGEDSTRPVTLAAAELEEFCWQYIRLDAEREAAKDAALAAAEVSA